MRVWCAVCVAVLASVHPSRCAKAKLPSWRGPDAFFDGALPSNRSDHGFAEADGRIYVFGGVEGSGESERMCVARRRYLTAFRRDKTFSGSSPIS
jgi:hypothetical protein